MTFSRSFRRSRLSRAAVVITTSTALMVSSAMGTGVAAAASHTPAEMLEAGAHSIAQLEAALKLSKTATTSEQWLEARKHVSKFYFSYYDPILEGPSRSLSPVGDSGPRKPQMEGFKREAIVATRACKAAPKTCDRAEAENTITKLLKGTGRDTLILTGYVSDSDPESTKTKAGDEFIRLLNEAGNTTTATPSLDELEKLAKQAATGEGASQGHVITEPDGSSEFVKNPTELSSEFLNDPGAFFGDDDDDGSSAPSGDLLTAVLVISGVLGLLTLGMAAATGAFSLPTPAPMSR